MKRIVSLMFVAILCLSLCTFYAFAVPGDGEVGVDTQPIATDDPPVVVTDSPTDPPVVTSPPPTAAPVYTKPPQTQAPVYTNPPKTQAPVATKAPNNNYNNNTPQNNTPQQQATVANNGGGLYNVDDHKIDDGTLKNKDWEDIKNSLKNADGSESAADDFDFIRYNDNDGDNGTWILYTGIAFEIIAVGIIVTLIVLARRRKKKVQNSKHSNRGNDHNNPSSGGKRPAHSEPQRASRQLTPKQARQVKKRSKYDTDEVYIPRNNPRQSGNGRYKPKH